MQNLVDTAKKLELSSHKQAADEKSANWLLQAAK